MLEEFSGSLLSPTGKMSVSVPAKRGAEGGGLGGVIQADDDVTSTDPLLDPSAATNVPSSSDGSGNNLGLLGVKKVRTTTLPFAEPSETLQLDQILENRKRCLSILKKYCSGAASSNNSNSNSNASFPVDSVAGLTIRLYESLVREITVDLVHTVRSSLINNSSSSGGSGSGSGSGNAVTTGGIHKATSSGSSSLAASSSQSSSSTSTATLEVSCQICGRSISTTRFAPHLEKCMGLGGRNARASTRK